jgi:uncharacterized protein (TIGR02246 family)
MRSVSLFLVLGLAFSAFLVVGCQPEPEAEETPAAETAAPAMTDEEMVQKSAEEFAAAWSQGDAAAIAAFWTEDGDIVAASTGELVKGRASLESYYLGLFEGAYKGTTISIKPATIRLLKPDVMVVDGSYELAGMKDAEGNDMPAVMGKYMHVSVKEGDEWRMLCNRAFVPIEAPGTT